MVKEQKLDLLFISVLNTKVKHCNSDFIGLPYIFHTYIII